MADVVFRGLDPYSLRLKDAGKVKALDVHPYHSWVVSADSNARVVLWDFARGEILRHFSLPGLQLDQKKLHAGIANAKEHISALLEGREVVGAVDDYEQSTAAGTIGHVLAVRFYDEHVLQWSCKSAATQSTRVAPPDWIIVVCAFRVLLINPHSLECQHIRGHELEQRKPTCCEPVSSSLIAIGCDDGAIRFWDWTSRTLVKTLHGHSKEIRRLMHVETFSGSADMRLLATARARSTEGDAPLRLVSVGQEGDIMLWDMRCTGNTVAGESPVARVESALGNVGLVDVAYNAAAQTLVTVAKDMTIALWDLGRTVPNPNAAGPSRDRTMSSFHKRGRGTNREMALASLPSMPCVECVRAQSVAPAPSGKVAGGGDKFTNFECATHPRLPPGSLLACTKGPVVSALLPSSVDALSGEVGTMGEMAAGRARGRAASADGGGGGGGGETCSPFLELFDLRKLVPGLPNKVKIYALRQHPLRSHLVICGTNCGLFVVAIDKYFDRCMMGFHRQWGPNCALLVSDMSLQRAVLEVDRTPNDANICGGSEFTSANILHREQLCKLDLPGSTTASRGWRLPPEQTATQLFVSPSGRFVAVVWPDRCRYQVLALDLATGGGGENEAAAPWQARPVDSDACLSFAWHHDSSGDGEQFAYLTPSVSIPGGAAPSSTSPKKSNRLMRRRANAHGNENTPMIQIAPSVVIKRLVSVDADGTGDSTLSMGLTQWRIDSNTDVTALPVGGGGGALWPCALFGGPLLCMTFDEKPPDASDGSIATTPSADRGTRDRSGTATNGPEGGFELPSINRRGDFSGSANEARTAQFFCWDVQEQRDSDGAAPPDTADGSSAGGLALSRSTSSSGGNLALMPVGGAMEWPTLVEWDASGLLCMVAKGWDVLIYTTEGGSFTLLTTLRVQSQAGEPLVSAIWVQGSLLYATHAEVWCAFPAAGSCETVLLASHNLHGQGHSDEHRDNNDLRCGSLRPPEQARPPGWLQLLGLHTGCLLCGGSSHTLFALELDHPVVRFFMLVTARHPQRALAWSNAIQPHLHDTLALFLERRGDVAEALSLSGLSVSLLLDLCIRHELVGRLAGWILDDHPGADDGLGAAGASFATSTRSPASLGPLFVDLGDVSVDPSSPYTAARAAPAVSAVRRVAIALAKAGAAGKSDADVAFRALRALCEQCRALGRHEDACFVAMCIGDRDLEISTLTQAGKWSDASFLAGTDHAKLLDGWNDHISQRSSFSNVVMESRRGGRP